MIAESSVSPDTTVCVIASYWRGHPPSNIVSLCKDIEKYPSGHPFDLVVVCNGGDLQPLDREQLAVPATVINRPNTGYNLGAWDEGWKKNPGYDFYLFVQDECRLRRANWVSVFIDRMVHDRGVGLLGESMVWDRLGWDFIAYDTERTLKSGYTPISHFLDYMSKNNIPAGHEGSHLQSLVWCVSGPVLDATQGIPHADTYADAVACEIGFSKLVQASGSRIAQLSPRKFSYIMHPQWSRSGKLKRHVGQIKTRLKRLFSN